MNAKKIMGAVLVALLALAVFAGAGAAATYFAYQTGVTGDAENSVWQNGANTVTITNGVVGPVAVAGTYTLVGDKDNTSYFTNPTATYSAVGDESGTPYLVANGGTAYKGDIVNITISSASIAPNKVQVITPSGVELMTPESGKIELDNVAVGTYKVIAVWSNGVTGFIAGAPLPVYDANVFTFTVISATEATISAAVDTIFAGDVVAVTVKGVPGETYYITSKYLDETNSASNQVITVYADTTKDQVYFTMPNTGEVTLYLKTLDEAKDEVKLELSDSEGIVDDVVIAVAKPTLTATLDKASYFIGEEIELTLSSELALAEDTYTYKIAGTNIKETEITGEEKLDGKNLVVTFTLGEVEKLDVGTYTIKIIKNNGVVATVPVVLKQPFISIIDAPEVVIQGKDAEFIINAEATDKITAYVFGTNFFMNLSMDNGIQVKDSKVPNKFTVTVPAANTTNMSTGQYFTVFQHPMYDENFNIGVDGTEIVLNEMEDVYEADKNTVLFDVSKRQTANAAQALCDALDSQNIDDMYVKASFFVVGEDESFTISEIPATIAQGETLTISGVSTANADGTVTVEMISTAFAAVPKETVGSAAFIAVSTKIAEDGTWEITMDTSDLNVDEYSLKVAVTADGKSSTWKNVNINVVEADEPVTPEQPEEPEQPEQPEEPVAPATPGFGALAALAGLGAVAVLLLRRE